MPQILRKTWKLSLSPSLHICFLPVDYPPSAQTNALREPTGVLEEFSPVACFCRQKLPVGLENPPDWWGPFSDSGVLRTQRAFSMGPTLEPGLETSPWLQTWTVQPGDYGGAWGYHLWRSKTHFTWEPQLGLTIDLWVVESITTSL